MEEIVFKPKDVKRLFKYGKSICEGKNIYHIGDDLLKFYIRDYSSRKGFYYDFFINMVDKEQIEWLSSLRSLITSSKLPRGIISCQDEAVGVLYDYFDGYVSFKELSSEDKELIFSNLKSAIEKNRELMMYGVFNTDLIAQNILYRGNDVELIDLDGRYVKGDYRFAPKVHSALLHTIYDVLSAKIETQYTADDLRRLKEELYYMMGMNSTVIERFPYDVVDKVEKAKIIK